MNVIQKKLSNDLQCLFVHSPGAKAGTVQIWFKAGSALESESEWGIAHFLEHMFFKGTQTRPGAKIASEVESFGGEINAFTSFDYTCYYINFPNPKLKESVSIIMDMVSHPLFNTEDLTPEREVVWEEYKRSQDNPNNFSFQMLQKNSFTGNYAHPILGREETIKSFSREQLLSFRTQFYNLKNAVLIISGDLENQEEIEKTIEQFHMPHGPASDFPSFLLTNKNTQNVHEKDVRQALLTIAIQCPEFNSEYAPAEDLAITCLAQGETSPLYQKLVVDSALATSVSTSTMFFAKGGCHFVRISAPVEKIPEIYTLARKTLKDLFNTGFNADEIIRNKNQYASSKIYDRESLESYAFSLGHGLVQYGDITADDLFIEKIKIQSQAKIHESFQNILTRPWHACLQIPKGSALKKQELNLEKFITTTKAQLKKAGSKLPARKITGSKFDPMVKLIEVKKGIKLLYRQSKTTPTFVFHCFLKGGLSEEGHKNNGIFNQIGLNLTKGYAGVEHDMLKEDLEQKSSNLGGFSGKNAYGLSMHGLSEHTAPLLKHFFGCLLTPEFPEKYLKLEKEFCKRVLENQKEDPVKQCFKEFQQIIFGAHPYALNPIGTPSSLQAISRKNLLKCHLEHVQANELVFTYCGDLAENEVLELILPTLQAMPPRAPLKSAITKQMPKKPGTIAVPLKREQTHVFIGKMAPATKDKNNTYLKMLTSHLSGQSSELFVEVRDKQGLCYAVQPVHFSALEGGYWGIYIGTGNDKVQRAISAIENTLKEIAAGKISKNEFATIKQMIAGQEMMALQTIEDYAQFYTIPVLQQLGIDFSFHQNQLIQSANYKDFQAFIKKFLASGWSKVIVGQT